MKLMRLTEGDVKARDDRTSISTILNANKANESCKKDRTQWRN